jgi:CRP-like cAMP-binding protein
LGPGSVFGDICPNCQWSFSLSNYAEAISDTTVGQISKKHFVDFLTEHPKVALNVMAEMNHRLYHLDLKTKSLALNDAEKRVLGELVLFAKDFGRQTKKAYIIDQRLTHEVIAAMAGLTRESVTYALNSLRRQKVIRATLDRHILIMKDKVTSNF